MFLDYIKLIRPLHWIKNTLIFLPPFFLSVIFKDDIIWRLPLGFLSFSLVASSIYIINDIFDREHDKLHPERNQRPLATGNAKTSVAWFLSVLFLMLGFSLVCFSKNFLIASLSLAFYFITNISYSCGLKNIPVLDVFLLSSGFVFRIFFGGAFFNIPISSWLFLCVFSVALYFAFGKRKSEFKKYADNGRPVLKKYTEMFLNAHYYLFCVLSILFYCLWTIMRTGLNEHSVGKFALTIPFMIFIVARYNLVVETSDEYADPVPTLFRDRWLLLATGFFVFTNFLFLYEEPLKMLFK